MTSGREAAACINPVRVEGVVRGGAGGIERWPSIRDRYWGSEGRGDRADVPPHRRRGRARGTAEQEQRAMGREVCLTYNMFSLGGILQS